MPAFVRYHFHSNARPHDLETSSTADCPNLLFIESMAAPSSQPLLKGWNQHVLNNCRYLNNFNKKCCFIYLLYVQNCSTCAGFSVGDPARAESKGTHLRPDRRGESGFSRPIARCGPRWKRIQQDRSEGSNGQSEDN